MTDSRTPDFDLLRRTHHVSEDCWYSCPLSDEGCCDNAKQGCTCGADEHNAHVDAVIAAFAAREARLAEAEAENERLREALRRECRCTDPDASPPTAWAKGEQGEPIPYHCDCVLYGIELPDPEATPVAYADAAEGDR